MNIFFDLVYVQNFGVSFGLLSGYVSHWLLIFVSTLVVFFVIYLMLISNKKIEKNHIEGPLGVRGRNSNNDLIREKLGWDYKQSLEEGIRKTYGWISWEASKEIYSDKNIVGMNVV